MSFSALMNIERCAVQHRGLMVIPAIESNRFARLWPEGASREVLQQQLMTVCIQMSFGELKPFSL